MVFQVMGLSINTMTLGGLAVAIGELVDDAMVDVENIFRRLRENRQAGSPRSVFASSSPPARRCALASSMHRDRRAGVRAAVRPERHGRPAVHAAGQAYIVSILACLVVSLTVTPVLAFYLLPSLKTARRARKRFCCAGSRRLSGRPGARARSRPGDDLGGGVGGRRRRSSAPSPCAATFCRRSTRARAHQRGVPSGHYPGRVRTASA